MLDFTPTEKRGIIITVTIILIAAVIQWIRPHFYYHERIDYSATDSTFYRSSQLNSASFVAEMPVHKSDKKTTKLSKTPDIGSIDLNSATKSELEQLPRIGPKTAERIIKFREEQNGFRANKDLMLVKGIGPKTFENIKPYLKELKQR